MEKDFDRLEQNLEKLKTAATTEDIVKSGRLRRIDRFIKKAKESGSTLGKAIAAVEDGIDRINEIEDYAKKIVTTQVYLTYSTEMSWTNITQ